MRKLIGRLIRGQRGFTLLEMATVVTIMALLTTVVAVAVTGTAGSARESSKSGDMKNVDTGASRFESVNQNEFPISGGTNPTLAIAGAGDT